METQKVEITSGDAPAAPTVAVIEAPPSAEMLRMAEEAGRSQAELAELRAKVQTQETELSALRSEMTAAREAAQSAAQSAAAAAIAAAETTEEEEEEETESGEITEVEIPRPSADAGALPVAETPSPARERGLMCRIFLGKSV